MDARRVLRRRVGRCCVGCCCRHFNPGVSDRRTDWEILTRVNVFLLMFRVRLECHIWVILGREITILIFQVYTTPYS